VDDARKRLSDHRAAFTWLDTGVLDGDIAIAAAIMAGDAQSKKEAVARFEKLRQGRVLTVALDRAMVVRFGRW
jgi:hypothetical protein